MAVILLKILQPDTPVGSMILTKDFLHYVRLDLYTLLEAARLGSGFAV